MSIMDAFSDEKNADIVVTSKGVPTGVDSAGLPVYGPAVTKYDGKGWFWQLSASEALVGDQIANPSTHRVVLDPALVISPVVDTDDITVNGEEYKIHRPDDILQLGEVITLEVAKKR